MSDQQKIWFIYLTDHHEGPFTAAEIADKAKAGLVSGQSLAWKDGMPEWVAAETIPELHAAMSGGAPTAAAPAAPAAGSMAEAAGAPVEEEEVSLAQLLAQSQGGQAPAAEPAMEISDSASVLSSMLGQVHGNGAAASDGSAVGSSPLKAKAPEPGPDDEVWTLRVGAQVSGLHSLQKLLTLASAGEIPGDAMCWHPGWSDFTPVTAVPQIEAARKKASGKGVGTKASMTRPGMAVSAMSNAAADNDEEPTDTSIEAPPSGFRGLLYRVHMLAEGFKRKKAAQTKAKALKTAAVFGTAKPGGAKAKVSKGGARRSLMNVLLLLLVVGAAGGGAYFYLLQSPLPSGLDVSEEDRQAMAEVVTMKPEAGHKLYIAKATGTEDSPADVNAPKYYVATNLADGAQVTLTLTGVPGTLVNRLSFEKKFVANVEKNHLATFEQVKEDGKPLWGEFNLKVTGDGAEPLEVKGRFLGTKGGSYQARLKAYKDSVQGEYDKEISELREYIATLKNLQVEASKQITQYKSGWSVPASHAKITSDWTGFVSTSQSLLTQLEAKLKERQGGEKAPKYHGRAFQDVSTTVGQLEQLFKAQAERLAGSTSSVNADEIDGLVQAGVQALEAWLAQAVTKTPFESPLPKESAAKATPAAKVAAPAPAAAPDASSAAPAAVTPAAAAPVGTK